MFYFSLTIITITEQIPVNKKKINSNISSHFKYGFTKYLYMNIYEHFKLLLNHTYVYIINNENSLIDLKNIDLKSTCRR